jgi:hypothetical protein
VQSHRDHDPIHEVSSFVQRCQARHRISRLSRLRTDRKILRESTEVSPRPEQKLQSLRSNIETRVWQNMALAEQEHCQGRMGDRCYGEDAIGMVLYASMTIGHWSTPGRRAIRAWLDQPWTCYAVRGGISFQTWLFVLVSDTLLLLLKLLPQFVDRAAQLFCRES